jgi:hypothetical protein
VFTSMKNILRAQDGKCAICRTDRPGGKRTYFHVDHDHVTNKVRGLLCSTCNTGMGKLGDSVSTVWRAVRYLLGDDPWATKREREAYAMMDAYLSMWDEAFYADWKRQQRKRRAS